MGGYVDPVVTELEFSTLAERGLLFALALQRLQTLYPRAYVRGSTYMIGPLRPEYELEKLRTTFYLFPFRGDLSPIQAHERRASDVGSKEGGHTALSIIN